MINLDIFPFLHVKFSPVTVVISSLILIIGVNRGLTIPLQPDRELAVIPPRVDHQLLGSQILFDLALVEVEHQEQQLLRHLGHH